MEEKMEFILGEYGGEVGLIMSGLVDECEKCEIAFIPFSFLVLLLLLLLLRRQ
jgi:hypothetical protein